MPRLKRATMPCPHCQHAAHTRSSNLVAETYRHIVLICSNAGCGHHFAAAAVISYEILYTIVPSAAPNPAVVLRTVPSRKVTLPKPANDEAPASIQPAARAPEVALPAAANDDDAVSEAVQTAL